MFNPDSPLGRLVAGPVRPGHVAWIGARPKRHAEMAVLAQARLEVGEGLVGDHYKSRTTANRGVTLIGVEDLAAIASFLGLDAVPPQLLRRNIVTRGINLAALKGRQVRIGEAVVEPTGECHPCSRMELLLGPGGYNAVRGHGGITARVVAGGIVRPGDAVERLEP